MSSLTALFRGIATLTHHMKWVLMIGLAAFSLVGCGSTSDQGIPGESPADYYARATIAVVNANAQAQAYAQRGQELARQQTATAQWFVERTVEAGHVLATQTAAAGATATELARPTATPLPTSTPLPTDTPVPSTATSTPIPATATATPALSATPNDLQLTATVAAFTRRVSRDSLVDTVGRNAIFFGVGAAVLLLLGYFGFKLLWNYVQALRLKNAPPVINIVEDDRMRREDTRREDTRRNDTGRGDAGHEDLP